MFWAVHQGPTCSFTVLRLMYGKIIWYEFQTRVDIGTKAVFPEPHICMCQTSREVSISSKVSQAVSPHFIFRGHCVIIFRAGSNIYVTVVVAVFFVMYFFASAIYRLYLPYSLCRQ